MPPRKIKVVDLINDIEDVGLRANEMETIEDVEPVEEHVETQVIPQAESLEEKQVSSIKTVELVECPECNKKMTKKSLKYSHAKNCPANKTAVLDVVAEKAESEEVAEVEVEVEEEELTREEQAAVLTKVKAECIADFIKCQSLFNEKLSPPKPPKLKRTVSVKPSPTKT